MEKTYVFDTADKGGFDSTALIASLMGNRGVDPNLMALIQNASKNQDAWGGGGMWWIWVIIMFWLWGGNGNMFGRNGMADGIPNQLNNDFGREVLLQAINGNGTALSQLATTLNCDVNALQTAIGQVQSSIQSIANQVGMTGQQIINSIQQGNCQLGNQLAQCCCNIQDSITRTNYENQISNLNQTNTLQNSINFVNSSVERGFAATAYATANQTCELKNAIAALVITTSREAMNSEVDSLRQKSLGILNSVDYHKKIVQDCEVLLQRLNPEFAEQKQQKQEIDLLKSQMSEMMSGMKELMAQFKSKEDTTKS